MLFCDTMSHSPEPYGFTLSYRPLLPFIKATGPQTRRRQGDGGSIAPR